MDKVSSKQVFRELARLRTIERAARAIRKDLLERAKWDEDAKVVCVGNGVWFRLNEALDTPHAD